MATKKTRLPDYVPDTITDKQIHDFLHRYYDVSNDGEAHDDYADFFTKDGEFVFNDKKAKGRDGMLLPPSTGRHFFPGTLYVTRNERLTA